MQKGENWQGFHTADQLKRAYNRQIRRIRKYNRQRANDQEYFIAGIFSALAVVVFFAVVVAVLVYC